MINKSIKVNQCAYAAPAMTLVTLEAESGMVLCVSSSFEDLPELDPDNEF